MTTLSASKEIEQDESRENSTRHLAFLDGVRGFAALYVVLYHVTTFSDMGKADAWR